MPDAHYFHATLYRFTPDARREVISKFNAAVQDVSARCSYTGSEDGHLFHIACPGDIGCRVDEVFRRVLTGYIAGEIAAAQQEERDPAVIRFSRGVFGERLDAPVDPSESTPSPPRPSESEQSRAKALPFHDIRLDQQKDTTLSFFTLRQLPNGMLERALAPGELSRKSFEVGVTLRAVFWNRHSSEYVFNGRLGVPITAQDVAASARTIIDSTSFLPLGDPDQVLMLEDEAPEDTAKAFNFVGRIPTVAQFIEGMGQLELVEPPDVPPIIPSDAKSFMARPNNQVIALGRPRIAKGAQILNNNIEPADYDDSKDEESRRARQSFARLLTGHSTTSGGGGGSSGTDSDGGDGESSAGLFSGLLRQSENEERERADLILNSRSASKNRPPKRTHSSTVIDSERTAEIETTSGANHSMSFENANLARIDGESDQASHFQAQRLPQSESTLIDYGNAFIKTDMLGLTSNAANQAEWEHHNPSAIRKNKYGIRRRQPQPSGIDSYQTSTESDAYNRSRQDSVSTAPTSSTQSPQKKQNIQELLYAAEKSAPWFQKSVRPVSIPFKPNNYSTPTSSEPSIPRSSLTAGQVQALQSPFETPVASSSPTQVTVDLEDEEEDLLIDLGTSDCGDEMASPKASTSVEETTSMSNVIAPGLMTDEDSTFNPGPEPDQLRWESILIPAMMPQKQYTMRQKAKKKGKGSKGKANKVSKVEVPQPTSPPPQRSMRSNQKVKDAGALSHFRNTAPTDLGQPDQVLAGTDNSDLDRSTGWGQESAQTQIDKLLGELKISEGENALELVVRFGMVLMQHPQKDFRSVNLASQAALDQIRATGTDLKTEFFPGMTTSTLDAQYLMGFFPDITLCTKVEYHIQVKTTDGAPLVIKFNQNDHENFKLMLADSKVATLYMHYPFRVWDAEFSVAKPDCDAEAVNSEKIQEFVNSIQSLKALPSFCANVPADFFNVEKVTANRIFTKSNEVFTLKVAEVQDLLLNSINSPRANFRAEALPREAMIEQHRLWWECSLHTHVTNPRNVFSTVLQGMIDEIVGSIDGVGFHNRGPWLAAELPEKENKEPEVPYW